MTTEWTTQEVAEFLGVKDGFVRRLRLAGRLAGKRQVGTTWVFSAAVVKRFKAKWPRKPGAYKGPRGPHRKVDQ
jgi:excisionase family DNA binding protein